MRRAASAAGVYMPRMPWRPSHICSASARYSLVLDRGGGLVGGGEHVGLDRAGHDLEHADPELRDLGRSDSPIALTAALLARYAPRNGTGASIDDDVTLQITPPPAARMIGIACLRHLDEPEHVGLEDRAPRVGRHHLEREVVALDAGVVHEHAQPVGQRDRRRVGHVEPLDAQLGPRRLVGESAPSAGSRIVATTSKPAARELDRDRAPDPPARARSRQRRSRRLP